MYNMGNKQSIHNIECELCKYRYGRSPIFYISDSTNLNGHTLCINCYGIK